MSEPPPGDEHPSGNDPAGHLDQLVDQLTTQLDPGARPDLAWTNPLGGRTYRLDRRGDVQYLKVSPPDAQPSHDLIREAERMAWIGSRVRVPRVLDAGSNEHGTWLRTRELMGLPASDHRWRQDPHRTARLLGHVVRRFHEQLAPATAQCPWSWRIAERVTARGSAQAAEMAHSAPPELDLVVAHGDLCSPNILLTNEPGEAGFLDLGKLGVADRAADLGCHVWSLEYNQLGEVIDEFLDAYGFTGDRAAANWYRQFYEVA